MRPSVNEIFDPDRVEGIYNQNAPDRAAAIALDRGTNYGVVRLELLEHLYEKLYMQRLRNPDETQWPAQILPNRAVLSASQSSDSKIILKLGLTKEKGQERTSDEEDLEVDYVFAATGYRRNAHQEILTDLKPLLSNHLTDSEKLPVARNYRVQYDEGKVDGSQAGIWLQGCNEETHGVSYLPTL
jgi:L-ornithine N5-monooxygenase